MRPTEYCAFIRLPWSSQASLQEDEQIGERNWKLIGTKKTISL